MPPTQGEVSGSRSHREQSTMDFRTHVKNWTWVFSHGEGFLPRSAQVFLSHISEGVSSAVPQPHRAAGGQKTYPFPTDRNSMIESKLVRPKERSRHQEQLTALKSNENTKPGTRTAAG